MAETITTECREVRILTVEGETLIEADVLGPFAVHKVHGDPLMGWAITVVALGVSFPAAFPTAERALAAAARLIDLFPDWSSVKPDTFRIGEAVRQSAVKIVLAEGGQPTAGMWHRHDTKWRGEKLSTH